MGVGCLGNANISTVLWNMNTHCSLNMSVHLKKTHRLSVLAGMNAKVKEVAINGMGELDAWKETLEDTVETLSKMLWEVYFLFSFGL